MKHTCPVCKIIWYCRDSDCPNVKCENCAFASDKEFAVFPTELVPTGEQK